MLAVVLSLIAAIQVLQVLACVWLVKTIQALAGKIDGVSSDVFEALASKSSTATPTTTMPTIPEPRFTMPETASGRECFQVVQAPRGDRIHSSTDCPHLRNSSNFIYLKPCTRCVSVERRS